MAASFNLNSSIKDSKSSPHSMIHFSDNIFLQRINQPQIEQFTSITFQKHQISNKPSQIVILLIITCQDLENYNKLSEHDGICKLLAFTKLLDQRQILAAFEYNELTIQEFIKTEQFQRNHTKFYVSLFVQMIEIIKMMVEIGIDLDQINYTNILIYHQNIEGEKVIKVKVLYDEREKIYDKVIEGMKIFSSQQKLEALLTNNQAYFMQNQDLAANENIYQLGMILIDLMYQCQVSKQFCESEQQNDQFINRDRPVSRSFIGENYQKSYFIFEDSKVKRNQIYLQQKVQYLKSVSSYVIKEMTEIALKMIAPLSERVNLDQLTGETQRIMKIFKDTQRKVRTSSIQKQMILNQNQNQGTVTIKKENYSKFNELNTVQSSKQFDANLATFNLNSQQHYLVENKKLTLGQDTKIINSSKNLKSEDVKQVYQSIHSIEYNGSIKNTLTEINQNVTNESPYLKKNLNNSNQQTKKATTLQSTKQTYNLPTTVNDIGYKTNIPSNEFPQSSHQISSPVIQNNNKNNQLNGLKVIIPRQQIMLNLKCHESVRGSLENLIDELQSLEVLIKKQYYDNSLYYGETNPQTNKRSGLGLYIYPQGDIYYGTWHENHLINGTYIFKNGQSYEGQAKNGKQGSGRYRYINGNVYEGEWKNDIKEGKGTMCYPNQDKYDGMWYKGKKNGFGRYFYNNGTLYEGNFANGRKSGFGTINFTNGTKIQANWNQTHLEGQGKVFYPNGDYFEGEYHFSEKHGKGLYIWGGSQAQYQGQFRKDTLQGQARIHFTDKQYYFGRIKNGKRDGQGTYQYQNGDRFAGEWKNDLKLIGNYKFVNGDEFQGKFKDNQLNFGVLKYANGQSYEGEFKNGFRNGVGSYKNRFGELVYEGYWEMDNFIHKGQ